MPRIARLIIDNSIWHVFNRSNAKREIFRDNEDFIRFLYILAYYKARYEPEIKLYHYCIMPNHFHLEPEIRQGKILPLFMHDITQTYSNYHHKKYQTVGYLWQGRYKNMIVEKGNYHQKLGGYIERNPVRAGLVEDPKDWPWSSYRFYAFGEPMRLKIKIGGVERWVDLVDEEPYYQEFGLTPTECQKNYRQLIEMMDDDLTKKELGIKEKKLVIGSTAFQETIRNFFKKRGIEINLRIRGRPRKT